MLLHARPLLFISLLAVAASASGEAVDATAALQRLGVVTHLDYRDTPYNDLEKVRGALSYIGLHTLRDMTPLANKRPYDALARDGFHFNFVIRSETINELPKTVAALEQFARRYPGSIVAIEGLNEIKYWPASYRGDKSFAGATAAQCELYGLVHNPASNLRELPVIALTLGGASKRDHDVLGDLSDCADVGNSHIYYGAKPPTLSWDFARRLARQATARKPSMAVTETGYATIDNDQGVPEDVQAKYLLFLVSRALREDIPLTFIYQLVDDRDRHDWSYRLGLYRHDWTPKPAAHAFHHFTRLLRGETKDAKPGKRAARGVIFALNGNTAGVESFTVRRDDGSLAILLWREIDLWDPAARKHISPRPRRVTLTIDAPAARLGDPLTGDTVNLRTVKSPGGHGSLTVELIDRPLIVIVD
jgi:trimeric autotransporter adhesin